jgi:hypothetical protein
VLEHDVLRRPEPLERLLDAIDRVQRLVLLGDAIELIEGRPELALEAAEPVLRAIGRGLSSEREVLVIPGNHDGPLVAEWVRQLGRSLAPATEVPVAVTPALERVVSWLSPAQVRVSYPGVWLAEGVWATHGHYLDRHLFPDSTFGIARGPLRKLPRTGALPIDYELARRFSMARFTRLLPRPVVALLDDFAELVRAGTMPRRAMLHHRVAPLTSALLGLQMRRASIPALARVVHRLGIDAEWVVFGHVHRLGPLDGDDLAQWRGPDGRPRIVNCGSWVYEPLLVHRAQPPHPYWPGGAVLIEDGAEPQAVGLLDGLTPAELRQ